MEVFRQSNILHNPFVLYRINMIILPHGSETFYLHYDYITSLVIISFGAELVVEYFRLQHV